MKISVITSTRNRKNFLVQTMASVQSSVTVPLAQVEIEHIIADDGSTDGTHELFTRRHATNIRYLRFAEHRGQSAVQNDAIRNATGDYIFILDDDDILLQRTLYNFARMASEHPTTQWFTADFLRVDSELRYIPNDDYYGWAFDNPEAMLESIFKGEHFIQYNVFFTRQLYDRTGGFDETIRIGQDLDLWIRFLLSGAMPLQCPFISHLHRFHESNLSQGISQQQHLETIAVLKKKYTIQ